MEKIWEFLKKIKMKEKWILKNDKKTKWFKRNKTYIKVGKLYK